MNPGGTIGGKNFDSSVEPLLQNLVASAIHGGIDKYDFETMASSIFSSQGLPFLTGFDLPSSVRSKIIDRVTDKAVELTDKIVGW